MLSGINYLLNTFAADFRYQLCLGSTHPHPKRCVLPTHLVPQELTLDNKNHATDRLRNDTRMQQRLTLNQWQQAYKHDNDKDYCTGCSVDDVENDNDIDFYCFQGLYP